MVFREGMIEGVVVRELRRHADPRGWLCELFRGDELPEGFCPAMAYLSLSLPATTRGPHAHRRQTDCFCFIGPSTFRIVMWDDRPDSPTYRVRQQLWAGADCPLWLLIPPGVVHAYRNVGNEPGLVFNGPDRLYRGHGRREEVDEIRHEEDSNTPFILD